MVGQQAGGRRANGRKGETTTTTMGTGLGDASRAEREAEEADMANGGRDDGRTGRRRRRRRRMGVRAVVGGLDLCGGFVVVA